MINTIVHYVNFYYPTLKNLTYSENLIKTALIYRFLYETTFKKHITLETIIYKLENRSIKSNNRILNNHLMFYRAFKSFHKHYKLGRGCVYAFDKFKFNKFRSTWLSNWNILLDLEKKILKILEEN